MALLFMKLYYIKNRSPLTFWKNTSPPSSGWTKQEAGCKQSCRFLLGLLFTLRMNTVHSSKTLVDCYQSTWHYNPEDHTLRKTECCCSFEYRIRNEAIIKGSGPYLTVCYLHDVAYLLQFLSYYICLFVTVNTGVAL
jgi:hypothetical protein